MLNETIVSSALLLLFSFVIIAIIINVILTVVTFIYIKHCLLSSLITNPELKDPSQP